MWFHTDSHRLLSDKLNGNPFYYFLFDFSWTYRRHSVCFLMYIFICEIFVSIYLYLKILKVLSLKKKQTLFFILWT